ncbi:MAG: cell wall hydrolase [Novosphingobium sp.]|nr:cell wall hydrolase [Novosphingobium sp.]
MKSKLNQASFAAVAASMIALLFSANGSSAVAEERAPAAIESEPFTRFVSNPVIQQLPAESGEENIPDEVIGIEKELVPARTLAELVAAQPMRAELSRDMHCLAGAIYFEARGESLAGQLAVGSVIVERANSGRFPDSYCGVVFQRSQFSFVRGNRMPKIRTRSAAWRNAVAIAQIADGGSWESPADGALFFHATRVRPGWRLTRIARVDNHVFYR